MSKRKAGSLRPWVADLLAERYPDESNLDELVERIVRKHLAQRDMDDYRERLDNEERADQVKLRERKGLLLEQRKAELEKRFGLS